MAANLGQKKGGVLVLYANKIKEEESSAQNDIDMRYNKTQILGREL